MKVDLQIVALAGCFLTGVFVSGLYYRSEIADMKFEYAQAAEQYQSDLRKKGEDYERKLAEAADAKQAEIDRLQSDLDGLRSEADRLRVASARRSAVPRSNAGACQSCQRQVSECVKLLSEGAGLFEEGSGLLRDFNADRKAVQKITYQLSTKN